ncbi:MAG: ECF transporter S component [Ruminococcus sp.]|nr:ECF transporter S component [Ruminococcus sp.]
MQSKTNERLKVVLCMAMLTALAVAADIFLRIPGIGGFLTYEPKDVILTIGAFIFGPVAGIIMSLVVCLIEMVTVSTTGFIGLLMNFLASAVFVGVSSIIYSRKKTLSRAILGLVAGSFSMLCIMLLWNYIMTPIFMNVPREAVLDMFVPILIPFNLLKAGLNSALILLLYKGVVTALRKSRLIPVRESNDSEYKKSNTIVIIIISALLVVTLIFVMLIFAQVIKL